MKKTALILMVITIVSKFFGFFRDITLSFYYGASNVSDAYLISITIPNVIFAFIAMGITTGYIPLYSKLIQDYGENVGNDFTNRLSNLLLMVSTILIFLGLCFTEPIVKLFAAGFEGETLKLAVLFTKISILGLYFTGLISLHSSYLQVKGNYIIPGLIAFPMNFLIILFIIFSANYDIVLLSIGTVIAAGSQLLLLIPFSKRKGYRYQVKIKIFDNNIKNMVILSIPLIVGVSVNQLNVLVDRSLASGINEGGISALHYANTLNLFVQGIFVISISTVIFPTLSKMVAKNNKDEFKKVVSTSLIGVVLLVFPISVGSILFSKEIIQILFGRGAFDEEAVKLTASALFYYSFGMLGFGIREIVSRVFYSLQDTKTPMINAAIAILINIILNLILSKYLGIGGLALATSISGIICSILLLIGLRKKIGDINLKEMVISTIKILVASLIMGVCAKFVFAYSKSFFTTTFSLVLSIVIGIIVYSITILLIRINLVIDAKSEISKKMKSKSY